MDRRCIWPDALAVLVHTSFVLSMCFGEQIKIANIPLYAIAIAMEFLFCIRKIKLDSMTIFSFLWIIVSTILLPFIISAVGTHPWIYAIGSSLILICVSNAISDKKGLLFFWKLALLAQLFMCAISTYEIISGNHFLLVEGQYYRAAVNNAMGFQVNINDNATALLIGIFSSIILFNLYKRTAVITFIWSTVLIYIIGSRLSLLTYSFIIFISICYIIKNKTYSVKKRVFFAILLCTVFLFFIVATINGHSPISFLLNAESRVYDLARVKYMQDALKFTLENSLFLGNGPGMTALSIGNSVHAAMVEILCDYGFVVFIFLSYFVIKLLAPHRLNIEMRDKMVFSSFAVSFVMMSFCSSSMLRIRIVWLIFALMWKTYCIRKEPEEIVLRY